MSLTFQHAMHVAIKLNQQYIWIDCLCILQDADSRGDWHREAATMKHVYANSFLNLSATSPRSASMGLDPDQTVDAGPSCVKTLSAGGRSYRAKIKWDGYWNYSVDEAPVNRRAWVLQERMLSRRILHFTSNGLAWECGQLTAHRDAPNGFKNPHPNKFRKERCTLEGNFDGCLDQIDYWNRWIDVVKKFTQCGLTQPSDRLVALSGIATYFKPFVSGDYLAGLWRDDLLRGLLWLVASEEDGQVSSQRPSRYVAPSWSWASVERPVRYWCRPALDDDSTPWKAELVDAAVELEQPKCITGAVRGGWLRMRAQLVRVTDWAETGGNSTVILAPANEAGFRAGAKVAVFWDDSDDVSDETDHFLLPMRKTGPSIVQGLLLCSVYPGVGISSLGQRFRRLGLIYCFVDTFYEMIDATPVLEITIV